MDWEEYNSGLQAIEQWTKFQDEFWQTDDLDLDCPETTQADVLEDIFLSDFIMELDSADASLASEAVHYPFPGDDDAEQPSDEVLLALTQDESLRLQTEDLTEDLITLEDDPVSPVTPVTSPDMPKGTKVVVEVPESTLFTPRSCYEPYDPGCPTLPEVEAISSLCDEAKKIGRHDDSFIELQLDDFAIYHDRPEYPEEMRSLHQLDTKVGHTGFFFDGVLSAGVLRFFVKRVPIAALPIGDYGSLSKHTVRHKIWLRSNLNRTREVYYRLGTPAKEYRRFFDPFLWVADLSKHFVDFVRVMGDNHRQVSIFHFRSTFCTWLNRIHRDAPEYMAWKKQHPSDDFRTSIVANLGFLYKEAVGVLAYDNASQHTIWDEILHKKHYEACEPQGGEGGTIPRTVVTQYIYDCFKDLPFRDTMEAVALSEATVAFRDEVIREHDLARAAPLTVGTAEALARSTAERIQKIKPGDTISTAPDEEDSGTKWRQGSPSSTKRWYGLVQSVHNGNRGRKTFDIIWYYRAEDTLCGSMRYPWANELFLSNHCSCFEPIKIRADQVLDVHEVEFFGKPDTKAEFFCRQTWISAERQMATLTPEELYCVHHRQVQESTPLYKPGETRLVVIDRKTQRSEPCEFMCSYTEDSAEIFRFRQLHRRRDVDSSAKDAPPNELVYGQRLIEVRKNRIHKPCYVRFFLPDQPIPCPYDRRGVGGFFYITHQETYSPTSAPVFTPLAEFPTSLKQGFDPDASIPQLRGFDLFCGGGNFGRGLEDGGAVAMKWANDFYDTALHTYMANAATSESVKPFLGSIDDLQRQAIQGAFASNVPEPGEVDFVSGGSPCPGFSLLTNDRTTPAQRKNQSLVAAFASFIDLYRPRLALLENVPGLVQRGANPHDVFGQLVCAIVGLGYQAEMFFIDASECGSPQRRPRVFVFFAAPGTPLPRHPLQTHAHPPKAKASGVGRLSNGEYMAQRLLGEPTPFPFLSTAAATADLPPIYDGKPDICVPFPDHRTSIGVTRMLRSQIRQIPTRPYGMNFARSWFGSSVSKRGIMTPAERAFFPHDGDSRCRPNSNAYGRHFGNRPLETVTTRQSPGDAKNGRTLHWREDRPMTIMEARRAQGFRDDEVLLGLPSEQYKIVGNSVAREVAVALGLVIREAVVGSLLDQGDVTNVLPWEDAPEILIESDSEEEEDDRSRKSPSETPATTIHSPTPPPSKKRGRSTSIAVELVAKANRSSRSIDAPSVMRGADRGVVEPSPLGTTVICIDED